MHVKSAIEGSVSLPYRYTWKSRVAVIDFNWRHLFAKPSTRISVRCKDLGDICCTSRGIAHFVWNFVAMTTRLVEVKFSYQHLMAHQQKPFYRRKNFAKKFLHKPSYIANFVPNFVAMATGIGQGKMQLAAFNGPSPKTPYRTKISPKSLTQAEL